MCAVSNRNKRIIEVIGPAGAGKTTLALTLSQQYGMKLANNLPDYRKFSDLPFYIKNTLITIPTLFELFSKHVDMRLNKRDLAWMVMLKGWPQILNQNRSRNSILVLDEGPIYYMAFLRIYGSEILQSSAAQTWWNQMYKQWSGIIHMVIYLDAPDTCLMERIRQREKPHGVKVKPDSYAFKYLADLRENYEYSLHRLKSENQSLKILRFDTLQAPLDQVASEVIAVI